MNPRTPTATTTNLSPSGRGKLALVVNNTALDGGAVVDHVAVESKIRTDNALSRNNGMDGKRWQEIHAMLSACFASMEFRNATGAMLPSSLDETIVYIHEAFKARLLNQRTRQRYLANLLRRAKRGDLSKRGEPARPLAELIREIKNIPVGSDFDERELAFWEDVLAYAIGVTHRDIRQFIWHAEADDTGRYVYIKTRKRNKMDIE